MLSIALMVVCACGGGGGDTSDAVGPSGGTPGGVPGGGAPRGGAPEMPPGPQLYVATNGNDANPGTAARPWRTIQKAMSSAKAGTTVNIRSGTYVEKLAVKVSGAPGSYITFQPEGYTGLAADGAPCGASIANGGYKPCAGATVVLDYASLGTASDGVPFLAVNGRSFVRIQGLTFQNHTCRGANQHGVAVSGAASNVEFRNNRFLRNRNTGDYASGSHALLHFNIGSLAKDIVVSGNELGELRTSRSEALSVRGAQNVTVESNYIHDTDGIAIDVLDQGTATIRGNLIEWSSKRRDGSWWYGIAGGSGAIYSDGGVYTTIEGNVVRDSGYCIQADAEPDQVASHHIVVRNNLLYRCHVGIRFGTWYGTPSKVHDNYAYNNTIYGSSIGLYATPSSGALVWKNNALVNNSIHVAVAPGASIGTIAYNLYHGGGAAPAEDRTKRTGNPRFGNPAAGDFRIPPDSPAKDAGDPGASTDAVGADDHSGNPRIVGGRVDVGAMEVNDEGQARNR